MAAGTRNVYGNERSPKDNASGPKFENLIRTSQPMRHCENDNSVGRLA